MKKPLPRGTANADVRVGTILRNKHSVREILAVTPDVVTYKNLATPQYGFHQPKGAICTVKRPSFVEWARGAVLNKTEII